MNAEVLKLQVRVVDAHGKDVEKAEAWLAKASRALLPTGFDPKKKKRPFKDLSALEARTIHESIESNEYHLPH